MSITIKGNNPFYKFLILNSYIIYIFIVIDITAYGKIATLSIPPPSF
jgi:hypothetical protein